MPTLNDPETPDGPEPHAFPSWPYFCLKIAANPGRPYEADLESLSDDLSEGQARESQAPAALAGNLSGAFWTLALTPYSAMWATAAAGLAAITPADGEAAAPSPPSKGDAP